MINISPDKHMSTPLYLQIANNIRRYILEGNIAAGEALPPERNLCDMTGTSRVTIRNALNKLVSDRVTKQVSRSRVAKQL